MSGHLEIYNGPYTHTEEKHRPDAEFYETCQDILRYTTRSCAHTENRHLGPMLIDITNANTS